MKCWSDAFGKAPDGFDDGDDIDLILGGLGGSRGVSRPVRRSWSNLAEMGFFAFNLRLDPLWRPNGPSERVLKPTMPSPTFDS